MQGEPSNEMFVVKSGKLDIYVVDTTGIVSKDKVEAEGMLVGSVDEPNAFIGEIGAILREPRSASIKAAGQTQVMVIDLRGKGFEQTIMGNPKLGLNLSKTIANRLGQTSNNLTRADSMALKVKGHLDNFSRKFSLVFQMIEKAWIEANKPPEQEGDKKEAAPALELPGLLNDIKSSYAFQVGKLAEKYNSVDMQMFAAMALPFRAHTNVFVNRIYKGGKAPADVIIPQGPPKPGVAAFTPGQVVCEQGKPDGKMYILLAGKLEVVVGGRSIETVQGKGAVFGEMAMFGDEPRTSAIRAITDVHAMPIPKEKIQPFLMGKPAVMLHVLRQFAKRLPLLNEVLLETVHQMTDLMHLFGACLNAYEALVPRIKTDLGQLTDVMTQAEADLEGTCGQLATLFDEINTEYVQLCSEIGYRPKEDGSVEVKGPRVTMPEFPVCTKLELLEELDSEHINFVINPKKDQFRACSIEFKHADLMQQAKIGSDMQKDFIFGRIYNYGESFPVQFLSFDTTSGGMSKHDKEYAIRAIKYLLEKMEQEVFILFEGDDMLEVSLVTDYIEVESDELVDEATIMEFFEKFKKEPDNRDHLTQLNNLYWDLIIGTIQKKLPKVKETTIEFEDKERKLINFGLLEEQFLPDNSNVLEQIKQDDGFTPSQAQNLTYKYIEHICQDVYYEAFGYTKLDKLNEERNKLAGELQAILDRIKVLSTGRLDLMNSFPNGSQAAAFVMKLDGLIKAQAILDRMMKAGRQLSTEQRQKIVQMKNARTALTNQLAKFFTAIKGRVSEDQVATFREYGEEYEKKCMEELLAKERLALHDEKVENHKKEMKAITLKAKETTYKNEIVRLKKYVILASKKSKVEPTAVLVNIRDIATRTRVSEIIDLFLQENVDPFVFDPKLQRIKKMGRPSILLVPGSGLSVYDWEKHMFLVPLCSPASLEESVANAFVEFHWDMDEDKSMRESYGDMKIYKKLSITKLKQQLTKDYIVWATQEAKGWKKLDKEVRGWFQTKIARQKKEGS
jgi:CRP-like cAMP-binding protein